MSDRTTYRVDFGEPIALLDPDGASGLVVDTTVCSSERCTSERMHLRCAPARRTDDGRYGVAWDEAVSVSWNGRLSAAEDCDDPALEARLRDAADRLTDRWRRLVMQRTDACYELRPAPSWSPGDTVVHADVFPGAFTPSVVFGGRRWALVDSYCPDPMCPCLNTTLLASGPDDETEELGGLLGAPHPWRGTSQRGRELWKAILADPALVDELARRRRELREAGPFIVGEAYEQARLRAAPRMESSDEGGYLQGGAIPAAWIALLFDAGRQLEPRLRTLALDRAHAKVSGDLEAELWLVDDPEHGDAVCLRRRPDDTETWLDVCFDDRCYIPLPHLRQRVAHGWPLISGHLLALVATGGRSAPSRDDHAVAIATVEALRRVATAAPTDDDAPFATTVDLGEVRLRVELTFPTPPRQGSGDLAPDLGFEADDDERDPLASDPADKSTALARAAYADWALGRGVPDPQIRVAAGLISPLVAYAGPGGWLSALAFRDFLDRVAPREVFPPLGEDLDDAAPGLITFVDWLEDVGHVDHARAEAIRRAIERSADGFAARMTDATRFGPTKLGMMAMMNGATAEEALAAPGARPAERPGTGRGRGRAPRWHPAEGERPPGPKERCPCGSGRRFKKCCKPR